MVEDDEDVRTITVQFLETLGYRALTARNGQEALQLTAGMPVDLVVSDIVMPGGMNGVDLARELRKRHPAIRVILASGYAAGSEDFQKADGTQEFLVLAKPYQQADIARAVRVALDRGPAPPPSQRSSPTQAGSPRRVVHGDRSPTALMRRGRRAKRSALRMGRGAYDAGTRPGVKVLLTALRSTLSEQRRDRAQWRF